MPNSLRPTRRTKSRLRRSLLRDTRRSWRLLFSFVITLGLELSDKKVYEVSIRALLGTASQYCEALVLKSRTLPSGTALGLRILLALKRCTTKYPQSSTLNPEPSTRRRLPRRRRRTRHPPRKPRGRRRPRLSRPLRRRLLPTRYPHPTPSSLNPRAHNLRGPLLDHGR